MKLLRPALLSVSILVGLAAGLQHYDSARAGTENLRFLAGVAENVQFCFGENGWHDGQAADLFADDDSRCYGPSSQPVWMFSRGKTTAYPTYYVAAYSEFGNYAWTACYNVPVHVYGWTDYGSTWIGAEWYLHTYGNTSTLGWVWLWIGANYWEFSEQELGSTVSPDRTGCAQSPPPAHHVHQTVSAYITVTHRSFTINGIYNQQSVSNYIHNWTDF